MLVLIMAVLVMAVLVMAVLGHGVHDAYTAVSQTSLGKLGRKLQAKISSLHYFPIFFHLLWKSVVFFFRFMTLAHHR
jgi:hypothetical protein